MIIVAFIILFSSFFDNIILPSFLHSYQGRSSLSTLTYFIFLYVLTGALQFLMVYSIIKIEQFVDKTKSKAYHFLMIIVLALLVSLISSLIFQLLEYKSYTLSSFILIVIYDLTISSIIIGILILRFFQWFKRNKNLYEFLYIISFSTLLLSLISAGIGLIQELGARYSPVTSISNPWDKNQYHQSCIL